MFEEVDLSHIELASQDAVLALWPQVDRVLQALGFAEAWVSDESTIADFGLTDDALAQVGLTLGMPVAPEDHLYAVAYRLKARDN